MQGLLSVLYAMNITICEMQYYIVFSVFYNPLRCNFKPLLHKLICFLFQ